MIFQMRFVITLTAVLIGGMVVFASRAQAEQDLIPIASGGVGEVEMDDLIAIQHHYNLKLIFAKPDGEYLANIRVQIKDNKGKVLINTNSRGPVFLVSLKPGVYTAEAMIEGQTRTQNIRIQGNQELVVYYIHLNAK